MACALGPALRRAALLGCLLTGAVQAAGLGVAPLSLTLQPGEQATAVTVTNRDDHPWVIQAQVKRWSQPDGHDHYQADPNLLATPVLFRIASNAKQVVRVGFRGGPPTAGKVEQAFRLFISEVPSQQVDINDGEKTKPAGVQFLLHLVLPVFVPPANPHVQPQWSLVQDNGQAALRLYNAGNVHLRLIEVSAANADGETLFDQHGLWYVLAGARHDWPLPAHAAKQVELHVIGRTQDSLFSADVVSAQ